MLIDVDPLLGDIVGAKASSSYGGWFAWGAFDGQLNASYWYGTPEPWPSWIYCQLNIARACTQLAISTHAMGVGNTPNTFQIQGSHDAITWDDLSIQNGIVWETDGMTKTFSWSNTVKYFYYRLYVTVANGPGWLLLDELTYSYPPPVPGITELELPVTAGLKFTKYAPADPINVWKYVTSLGSYFGTNSWVIDCGEYTGPSLPLGAPRVLPTGYYEIDTFIGLPNPNGVIDDFADGSYETTVTKLENFGIQTYNDVPADTPGSHMFMVCYRYGSVTATDFPDLVPSSIILVGYTADATFVEPLPPAIGEWSRTDYTGYFWPAWASDCGEYTGPWPPIFAPTTQPAGTDEVDWYIGLPNPDGWPNDFYNNTYTALRPSNLCIYGTVSEALYPFEEGSHLILLWTDTDWSDDPPIPTVQPLEMIPVGYTAGGTLTDIVDLESYPNENNDLQITIELTGRLDPVLPPPVPPVDFAGISDPIVAPTLTKSDTADGHLLVGTYRYSYAAWKGSEGQATAQSPTADITLVAEDTVTLTFPTIANADGYLVYREEV